MQRAGGFGCTGFVTEALSTRRNVCLFQVPAHVRANNIRPVVKRTICLLRNGREYHEQGGKVVHGCQTLAGSAVCH